MIHPATRFSTENRCHLAGGWPGLNFEKHLWLPGVANFMLPRFRLPRGRLVGKDLFLQARAGTAAPVLARPQDSLWPLRWFRLAKSRQESLPQRRYSPLLWRVQKRLLISCL